MLTQYDKATKLIAEASGIQPQRAILKLKEAANIFHTLKFWHEYFHVSKMITEFSLKVSDNR